MSVDSQKEYAEALDQLRQNPDDPLTEARVARMEAERTLTLAQDRLTAARLTADPIAVAEVADEFDQAEENLSIALAVEEQSMSQDP